MCLTPGPLDQIVFLLPADPRELLGSARSARGGQGWKWKHRFSPGVELSEAAPVVRACSSGAETQLWKWKLKDIPYSLSPAKPLTRGRQKVPGIEENRRKIVDAISAQPGAR